jgi:peptide methionine sulfoxide reductase MsrB
MFYICRVMDSNLISEFHYYNSNCGFPQYPTVNAAIAVHLK